MGAECEHTRITRSSQEEPEAGSSRKRILAPGMSRGTLAVSDAWQRILNEVSVGLVVLEAAAGAKEVEGAGPVGGGGFWGRRREKLEIEERRERRERGWERANTN
ncbi:hypothetical protein CDL15_Pgr028421 [Punica granatum]|uniref:Uncharacterized protein n=1 Tax=Punica granatum TaxID=22663 RepID=A0A218W513_PUNGR|nr:hypothetical protein CDL15_Pgr028421 [Punica granatum]